MIQFNDYCSWFIFKDEEFPKLGLDWYKSHPFVTRTSGTKNRYYLLVIHIGFFKRVLTINMRLNKAPYRNYEQYVQFIKKSKPIRNEK